MKSGLRRRPFGTTQNSPASWCCSAPHSEPRLRTVRTAKRKTTLPKANFRQLGSGLKRESDWEPAVAALKVTVTSRVKPDLTMWRKIRIWAVFEFSNTSANSRDLEITPKLRTYMYVTTQAATFRLHDSPPNFSSSSNRLVVLHFFPSRLSRLRAPCLGKTSSNPLPNFLDNYVTRTA